MGLTRAAANTGHDGIAVAAATFRAAQPGAPFRHFHLGAVALDEAGDIGLDLLQARVAPGNELHMRPLHAAQGHRLGFVFAEVWDPQTVFAPQLQEILPPAVSECSARISAKSSTGSSA